jgi:hypothetical protein
MKKVLIAVAVTSLLSACGTTQTMPSAQQREAQEIKRAEVSFKTIPDWFSDVPKNDGSAIYAVGDGVSSSASGAIGNARANAFEGICQTAGGTVRSQTKIFRTDTEKNSTSISTTAIRNVCPDVDVTGAAVVKQSVVMDGTRYRAYVLVGLPLGDNNILARVKQQDRIQERALDAREREFEELDNIVEPKTRALKPADKVSVVTPGGGSGVLNLMPVENEEYKARRAEALKKPGAVVGQVTINN